MGHNLKQISVGSNLGCCLPYSDDVSKIFLWLLRDFVPEYHLAKFGGNWTTNIEDTEGVPILYFTKVAQTKYIYIS